MRDLTNEDAETVAMISQAAESAATLTRRLLTFARQNQFNRTRVEVASLIEDTMILLRAGLPESVRLSHHIPEAVRPVDIDANGLEQALVNLAMNASDAMPRGGDIVISCANLDVNDDMIPLIADLAPGSYVAISVSDSGKGMTPEVLSKAFEPFFTTKDVGRGTGLGLSTVYGFAKQAGGGVTIYSEVGHGTTVSLYLPAFLCAEHPQARPAPAVSQRTADALTKILIVEDQPQVRAHVARTLTMLGYNVATAPDAVTALTKIKEGETYDLLFTDIIMPGGMNGQELGEAVAELAPKMKILYSSGYPADAFTHLGLKEQSNLELLSKPYKSSELMEAVARLLGAEAQLPTAWASRESV
ncbi:MAG: response regulator [Sphingopyxis sp.]|nr:response regulator [Sphingopyxis sp.]